MTNSLPLSLYIHIPWCIRKCPYCDFNSHQHQTTTLPEKEYINYLINDLKYDLHQFEIERPLQSIFIGGGTPSLFNARSIDHLLTAIDHYWGIPAKTEITLEANPGTVEQQRFTAYQSIGINRLSLGIQSFDDQQLQTLGRIHQKNEAINAINIAKKAGFTNINLDLMFGLPQQSIEAGLNDLQQAIALQPQHISWYQLTLEPNTIFYKKPPKLPNDDDIFTLQKLGQTHLAENNFFQYEISAYAKTIDYQCQHNKNYWQFGDYLGIGAGAHGKLTLKNDRFIRTRKVKQPDRYLTSEQFIANQTFLNENDLAFEYMLNSLRLNEPVSLKDFEHKTGLSRDLLSLQLQQAKNKNLLEEKNDCLIKTELGERFLNDLLSLFL